MGQAESSLEVKVLLALPRQAVAVSARLLEESFEAVWALETLLFSVSFLVVEHVAQFGRLDVAEHALEKLIGAASLLVHHILLHEAHVAGVTSEPVADSLLDDLFHGRVFGHQLLLDLFVSGLK